MSFLCLAIIAWSRVLYGWQSTHILEKHMLN